MIGYLLVRLGVIAVLAAFLFRSPVFVGINGHSVEVWLLVLIAGLIAFSTGL